jgi:hypothetical protein
MLRRFFLRESRELFSLTAAFFGNKNPPSGVNCSRSNPAELSRETLLTRDIF